jgi:hypothetical protein
MSDVNVVKCLRCQGETEHVGKLSLVTGASSAASKLIVGQLAEMGEKHWDVQVFRCTHCGHAEIFDLTNIPGN